MPIRRLLAAVAVAVAALPAGGWDAHGHRVVTLLALDMLGPQMPDWLKTDAVRARIAAQSNEPDRWKGWQANCLHHINKPDHYLDIELLEEFGLTLETMPRLRREYLRAMIISKHVHPEQVSDYDASRDAAGVSEWPGFALHAIDENYAKLQATFNQLRILEKIDDPRRAEQVELLRNNAIFHMGVLAHFVADLAQPLHTTKHYDGWKGDNPHGYTTERGIHRAMDGALADHGLTYANLKPLVQQRREIKARDPWEDMQSYLRDSFDHMEETYRLHRDGQLGGPAGRALVTERVLDGADMLAALYRGAWLSARARDDQVGQWLHYNDFDAEAKIRKAASQPAASQPETATP